MWCDGRHQVAALNRALPGDVNLTIGEVPQATVHQLAGPSRGAKGQILPFEDQDREATGCRIKGYSGSGYPAPDDNYVKNRCG